MSHVCLVCDGLGTVRIKGRPGWERVPCKACGGSGAQRPGTGVVKIPYADTWPDDAPEMTVAGLRYHVVPDHDADATVESEWRR